MQYLVRAITTNNQLVRGLIEANDRTALDLILSERGWYAVEVRVKTASQLSGVLSEWSAPKFELLLTCEQLKTLLNAGLSLMESLQALAEQTLDSRQRSILDALMQDLRRGLSLSAALSRQPKLFPPLLIGLVRASESTGGIAAALDRYVTYANKATRLRNSTLSALLYPAILTAVGTAVLILLMVYVVPRFASVYSSTGRELPWLTEVLIKTGQLISDHALLAAMIALIFCFGSYRWISKGSGGLYLLRRLYQFPLIGAVIKDYELSRLYLSMGTLLQSGLPAIQAMHLARETLPVGRQASFSQAVSRVTNGAAIRVALDAEGLCTPVAARLLIAGERTGQLAEMCLQVAGFLELTVTRFVERFTRLVEPLLMLLIGAAVGAIVLLLYLPIFDLASSLP
jgi:general secretion pathway protein F